MPSVRAVAAALAAVAIAGIQATEVPLPPCLDPFQPFVYAGCFEDTGNPQALTWRTLLDQYDMTVETCVAECKGNGYRYAGLAYYGVCYCGTTVSGSQIAEDKCSFPCSGNSSQTCGGDSILSVYQDPTFLPLEEASVEDYSPLGCWTDDSSQGRALVYKQDLDGATLTTQKCLQKCRDGGYPFAGAEFGGECFCGVVIGNGTYAAPAAECDMPCNGAEGETCGGRGRLSLYVADELQSLEPCGYVPPEPSSCAPTTSATITPPPTTTPPSTATTTSPLCVSTTTVPSTCEYKCGNFCSDPLPEWDNLDSCKAAYSNCKLQISSCFRKAGWPAALECFDFSSWCQGVQNYCGATRSGWSKPGFCKAKPPKGSKPPTTTVYTTTCAPTKPATTTTTKPPASSTTKCPIPTPTNICKQPSNSHHNYGPGKPVGGIEMPIVTCNDLADEYSRYPFKLYNEPNSRNCKKYPRNACTNACADACKEQYEDCINVYAEGCRQNRKSEADPSSNYFSFNANSVKKRTIRWRDSFSQANGKCKQQYTDCLYVNRESTGNGKCSKYGSGW